MLLGVLIHSSDGKLSTLWAPDAMGNLQARSSICPSSPRWYLMPDLNPCVAAQMKNDCVTQHRPQSDNLPI
ncbi:hypothetical protein BT63DRAFT_205430 [Microthyrium microscopicum]|uniref:Uncharacterized protein n=1 Tax=Microthyrium microscopicum TaxID=703497 RepID=A0A6A6UHS6_9PEZI|nr:hypothetical protein BT63DRAFT_205430 [Microthyrium microscopicum]